MVLKFVLLSEYFCAVVRSRISPPHEKNKTTVTIAWLEDILTECRYDIHNPENSSKTLLPSSYKCFVYTNFEVFYDPYWFAGWFQSHPNDIEKEEAARHLFT